jgi:hypothetical protein
VNEVSESGQDIGKTESKVDEKTSLDQIDKLISEHISARKVFDLKMRAANSDQERQALALTTAPDDADFARRIIDLAAMSPAAPKARDGLLWVVELGTHEIEFDGGPWAHQFGRAIDLLVLHHANDEAVSRVALIATRHVSQYRDSLIHAAYDNAKDRVAKGTATLALADYLINKAERVKSAKKLSKPLGGKNKVFEDGKSKLIDVPPIYGQAYWNYLRSCDDEAMKLRAEALYGAVINQFADIPYVRWAHPAAEAVRTRDTTLGRIAESRVKALKQKQTDEQ